ncbi:MAG: pre-peptidase C-terminal domain-containing protein [Planctomycetes bacterium]|nr:pre-peptidase C-terminal domain-containing protein [Planctomycetota bacterium]
MRVTSPITLLLLALSGILAAAEHGGGKPVRIDELPDSGLKKDLSRLPPQAQAKALAWLSGFRFHDRDCGSLHADSDGGILYACDALVDAHAQPADAPVSAGPVVSAGSVPIANQPSYHSRPGSAKRIFLDFNGATVTGTRWNVSPAPATYVCPALDTDSDPTTFSDAEQLLIQRVWERVSEDYAPFDVDVTTDPAVESAMDIRTGHVLITRQTDANGAAMPYPGSAGVAAIDVFGTSSYRYNSPALVYFDAQPARDDYLAEVCSHEMGHNMGLSHDGTSSAYYGGHGSGPTSWGPIMGAAYNRNISQWSKGEYFASNQPQDDLAILNGKLTYRTDDVGSTDATATRLTGTALGASGVISTSSDVDVISFDAGAGTVSLTVSPRQSAVNVAGNNLDVKLTLADAIGTVIATSDVAGGVTGTITATVTAGTYFLRISGAADGSPLSDPPSGYTAYASLGQWFLTGTVPASSSDGVAPTASASLSDVSTAGGTTHSFLVTYVDNSAIATATIDSSDVQVTGPGGFSATATLISVDQAGNGTPRVATYRISAPGGAWDASDNGTYSVAMLGSAVADSAGNYVAAGALGSFVVRCPIAAGPGTGILRQWYDGVPGTTVASLTAAPVFPNAPTGGSIASLFEVPADRADDYGSLMRGWFIAPITGSYTFLIASDDASELWLSSDAAVSNISRIAFVSAWTSPREWNKESNQSSAAITLSGGGRYYIEARHKEGTGGDHLAVGVVMPGGITEAPIPANRLDPYIVASITATDAAANEAGDPGTFRISRPAAMGSALTVAYQISGSAGNGSDYASLPGSVAIAAGASSATVTVSPLQDSVFEGSETVTLTIVAGSGYVLGSAPTTATVTISDDEAAPTVTIAATDANAAEPADPGAVVVTLSRTTTTATVVSFVVGGSATQGADYSAIGTSVSIPAGSTSATVVIAPVNDSLYEPAETVSLTLTAGSNYSIGSPGAASVTIGDDDPQPSLRIANASRTEGDSGTATMTVTVTLSVASGSAASAAYTTADGSALAGADYLATSGTLTIPAGQTTATIAVPIVGDTIGELTETFTVTLSAATGATIAVASATGTITDNDPPSLVVLDASSTEGSSGSSAMVFTITLAPVNAGQTVTVRVATSNGTAIAGSDFTALSATTVIFAPGDSTKTVTIALAPDTDIEADESFSLLLSSPTNAVIGRAVAIGTIRDDDAVATADAAGGQPRCGVGGLAALLLLVSVGRRGRRGRRG